MRARTFAVLASFLLCVTASARVISYSPYSNRISTPVAQERTTRHFALLESVDSFDWEKRELVLYDTQGDEPRVVFPPEGVTARIDAAALFQAGPDEPVSLLVVAITSLDNSYRTYFSADAGVTWKPVSDFFGGRPYYELYSVDSGGPYVRGLTNPIRVGNAEDPFVVGNEAGVWAIDKDGKARQLSTRPGVPAGQNRAGTLYLIARYRQAMPNTVDLEIVSTGAGFITIGTNLPVGRYYGWIASDESAYVVAERNDGRFLFHVTPSGFEFVRGPYDASPEPANQYRFAATFTAVPTHDFNGAWMTQRGPGRPSNLARHTNGGGIEEMWSDVTGPDIEALIAGDSGETVLIQVHRERPAMLEIPFLDPALAVWHVGTPMPREYDELYLDEELNKGFVHVDVDRMEAGDLFVFDSGSFQDDGGGPIISPAPGGGGDVVQEWGVVRASLKQRLVLPGVARLPGGYGSYWLTDVTLFNPMDEPQDVEIRFVPLGAEAAPEGIRTVTVTLAKREIRAVPDALGTWFGIAEGGGAIHLAPARGINAFARTYNRVGEGTYGFGMMAIDSFNTASARFPVTFAGAFPGEHFRTNLLLTDMSGRGTQAGIGAFGVSGLIGSPSSIFAPSNGIMQFNNINSTMRLFSRESGGLLVLPANGAAIATVVAIDNRTNDPTYFPPDVATSANLIRAIPVIGHVDGANGSRFRSDLYVYNPNGEIRTVTLEATRWDNGGPLVRQFTLLPFEARTIVDALATLFQTEGLARLRYWSNDTGNGVTVTSRTYTLEESGATYGSLVPPLNNFQIAANGNALEIIGVSGGGNFRTNLAFVEMSPMFNGASVPVRVRIIDNGGIQLDTFTLQVPRGRGMQINNLFAERGIAVPSAALIVVEVLGDGLISAYATLTDNITNDTTFLGANLGATE